MNASRSLNRRRVPLAIVFVLAVSALTAACDSGAAKVATVDGSRISGTHFAQGVGLFAKVSGSTTLPDANGVSPTSDAALYGLFLVKVKAIDRLNEAHHSRVSSAEYAEMRKQLLASQQGAELKKMPNWFIDQLAAAQADYQALIRYYGARVDVSSQIKAYYQANKDQFRQVCMDVIASMDAAQLKAAKQQIEAGTPIATVAKAVAAEQPAGSDGKPQPALGANQDGDVGCVAVANLSSMFASQSQLALLTGASDGALVGPISISGGSFLLFRVRNTSVESLAQATPTIQQALGPAGQNEAQDALNTYLSKAEIELNPRLGSWTTGVGYAPPPGATKPHGAKSATSALTGDG